MFNGFFFLPLLGIARCYYTLLLISRIKCQLSFNYPLKITLIHSLIQFHQTFFPSIITCLEIFLTSQSVKMERERKVPPTATGTNLGSEYFPHCVSAFVNTNTTRFNQISVTARAGEVKNRARRFLLPCSEWSCSESQASPWASVSSEAEGWAAG